MVWKEQGIIMLKTQLIQQILNNSANITELCKQFDISRVTAYKWIKRYKEEGIDGLYDRSRRPSTSPQKTKHEQVDLILEIRDKYPAWGGRKLRQVLINEGHERVPSEATFNRILKIHEKIDPEESKKRTKWIRFEHENPNDLWQMDFKGHFQMTNGRCHPLTILDDHSRYSLCLKGFPNEKTFHIQKQLEEVFSEYGLPLRMSMDNGPQWKTGSKLSVWLMRQGIKISHSRPYHPQTQGKEERFHRTLKEELLKYKQFNDLESAQKEFDEWRELYNCVRPHEGIGMVSPVKRFIKSERKYSGILPEIEYEADDIIRKVRSCGEVSYKGNDYFIGEFLKGEYVALRQMKENSFEVYFAKTRMLRINL